MRDVAVVLALAFFGSLPIDPAVLAQEAKLTTKTVPDDKYGKGGTKEAKVDEKSLVHSERWKDKNALGAIPARFCCSRLFLMNGLKRT